MGKALVKEIGEKSFDLNAMLAKLGIISGGVVMADNMQDVIEELVKKIQEVRNAYNFVDRLEMKKWENAFKALYNIPSDNDDYYGTGAQCAKISSIINDAKNVKITNLNSDTLIELATVMQDKEGYITPAQMKFLERVISAHDIDIKELIAAMGVLKKDSDIIDMDKSALFLSLYLLPESNIRTVVGTLSKHYGFEIPEGLKQTTETTSSITNNQVTNNTSPKQMNSKYTIEESLNHLKAAGVDCRIEDDGIVIEGGYKGNPTEIDSHSTKLKNKGFDEKEILKYVTVIKGKADFRNSQITSLGNLRSIGGYADFRHSQITSLGNLQSIGGSAHFYNSQITSLGNLQTIGGWAMFGGSQITSLGNLKSIGGDAYTKNSNLSLNDLTRLRSITKGKIK